ncbi:MAG: response regulator [Ktedonobacteraceae bacterium]|nr:response regulator [Ktedonobacteraceae bacterium]
MSKRILVIEPSRTIRAIFALKVQQVGHQVTIFKNYEVALAALPRLCQQPPEIAFVALHADRPESAQALMRLRVLCPQTTLIMMISQDESKKLVVQRIAGAVLAVPLLKPFRIQDVLTLVATPMQAWTRTQGQEGK